MARPVVTQAIFSVSNDRIKIGAGFSKGQPIAKGVVKRLGG